MPHMHSCCEQLKNVLSNYAMARHLSLAFILFHTKCCRSNDLVKLIDERHLYLWCSNVGKCFGSD